MSTAAAKYIDAKVADIIVINRIREGDPDVEKLADSIKVGGQLQPIIINCNNRLIGGGRRLAAHKLLNLETIEAKVVDVDDDTAEMLEIMENNERKEFSFREKLKITHKLQQRAGERRGRPKKKSKSSQGTDNETDKNIGNFRLLENLSSDKIAEIAGWGSYKTMGFALTVEKTAIPEVIEAIGNSSTTTNGDSIETRGGLSVYGAYRISQLPKKKQLQALNEAVTYLDNEGDELSKSNNARRAAKRKDKNKVPKKRLQHQQYNVIRVAPDWDAETESDILATPVNDYASDRICVVAVECPGHYLPNAMDCLAQWNIEYITTITVWNPNASGDWFQLTTNHTVHIVLGIRRGVCDLDEIVRFSNLVKTAPVHAVKSTVLSESLIPIIEGMFPDLKHDRRIDMSATEPRKNWIVWKIAYADEETAMATMAKVDAEIMDQIESSDDDAGMGDLSDSDGVPVEQQEADLPVSSPDLDSGDEEVFEPARKSKLKIFG